MQIKHSNQPKQLQAMSNSILTWKINFKLLQIVVELQWPEHLLNHEKMFETRVVQANER